MENIKGVFGLVFILSFVYQLFEFFTKSPNPGANLEEYAIRTGTTLSISLILGVLLLRSSLKNKRDETLKITGDDTDKRDYFKIKKVGVVVGVVILLIIAFILGTKNSKVNREADISNKVLLEECLKQTESIDSNTNFYKALDATSDCDKKYGDNNY